MQQAIIWTNAEPVHRRIFAALGEDELTGLVTLVIESRNTYLNTWTRYKRWQKQREITQIINFDLKDHADAIHENGWELSMAYCIIIMQSKFMC